MKRILIIANCQTGPLAQIFAVCGQDVAIDGIPLDSWHDLKSGAQDTAKTIVDEIDENTVVFSFNVGDAFGSISTQKLRPLFGDRLIAFTNIRFDGLHPDSTYFGKFGGRWPNFLSEYHSKLITYCYSTKRSVSDCLQMFNGKVYEKLGYYEIFANSERELRKRDEDCDVRFSDEFFEMIKDEYCLLTINHPTSIVFHRLARALAQRAHISFLDFSEHLYPNPLVQSVVWPIYNEVAEHFLLKYRTPQYFIRPPFGYIKSTVRSLSLEEFVRGSYKFYDDHFKFLEFSDAVLEMDFHSRFRDSIG
jgi:hypothetical protein